jgi:methionyl-tRNA formyltransferase
VLGSVRSRIDALDTAGTLHDRLALAGADLMVQAMAAVAQGEARPIPQPPDGATYARKIRPAEARLRWDRPAARIDRQIRGLAPFPGAWFLAPSERGPIRVKALLSAAEDGEGGAPGEVIDDGLLIACKGGAVRILRAQREGRGAQGAEDFLRGFPLPRGARLT